MIEIGLDYLNVQSDKHSLKRAIKPVFTMLPWGDTCRTKVSLQITYSHNEVNVRNFTLPNYK